MTTKFLHTRERRANQIKMESHAIYMAYKDPRVLGCSRILIIFITGYAFSPRDNLLPNVPIIRYPDHLILAPLGVTLAFKKMIPSVVWTDCQK
jgi:uncharacterized membrane protein YkvA (DUF1232 family)